MYMNFENRLHYVLSVFLPIALEFRNPLDLFNCSVSLKQILQSYFENSTISNDNVFFTSFTGSPFSIITKRDYGEVRNAQIAL